MNIENYITGIIQDAVRKIVQEELEVLKQEILPVIKPEIRAITAERIEPESKIIRPKELANMLSISIPTLYRMQHEGKLPPKVKMSSRAVGWLRSDIEDWLINKKQDE